MTNSVWKVTTGAAMAHSELDNSTVETARKLAAANGCTLGEFADALLRQAAPGEVNTEDRVLGLMADDPDLMDRVVEVVRHSRENASLRLP
jgi:hypothetical protein